MWLYQIFLIMNIIKIRFCNKMKDDILKDIWFCILKEKFFQNSIKINYKWFSKFKRTFRYIINDLDKMYKNNNYLFLLLCLYYILLIPNRY